jgi:hypothetical protein
LKTIGAIALSLAFFLAQGALAQTLPEDQATESVDEVRPGPPPPLPDLSDPNSRTGEALAEPDARSGIPKVLRGSASKAGGPANELNPSGAPEWPAPMRWPRFEVSALSVA